MDYRLPIVLLWLAGLGCAFMPVPSLETQFFAASVFCTGAAFFFVLRAIYKKGAFIPHTPLMWVGLVFWVIAFLSVIFSEVKLESYQYFWFFSSLPFSFLIFTFLNDTKIFRLCLIGAGGIIAALALVNLYFYLAIPEWLYRGQAGWPFADPNALAALLSLGFFGAISGIFLLPKKWHRCVCLFVALLFCTGLMITGSRAAILALIIAFLIFGALNLQQLRQQKKYLGIFAAAAVLIFGMLEFAGSDQAITPYAMISSSLNSNISALDARPAMWASALQIFRTHFWTGTGIGTFYLYYPEVREADYGTAGLHAHNDPLEFASDMGVAAPLLFYAFIILALIRTFKALPKADAMQRLKMLAPFCALGAMIAHTHVEFNFYVLPTLMITGLILAYWLRITQEVLQEPPQCTKWPPAGVAFAALMLIFGLGAFAAVSVSDMLIQKAEIARARGDLETFASSVNAASGISRGNNAKAFLLASSIPIGLLDIGTADREALIKQAQGLLDKAWALNPRSAAILAERARLAEWQGHPEESTKLLEKAVALNPLYLPARLRLASWKRTLGQNEEAYEILKAGLRWPAYDGAAPAYYADVATSASIFGDDATAALAVEMQDLYKNRMELQERRRTLDSLMEKAFSTTM